VGVRDGHAAGVVVMWLEHWMNLWERVLREWCRGVGR
jgi:hypothetical protein